jgi:Ca-activated chloride channel family protein
VFTNLPVLEAALGPRHRRPRSRLVAAALLALALVAAATAAARPVSRLPVQVDNATIVLVVDVSGSMSARDVEPTRLDAAVAAMRGFVQRLPDGFKVGLVQFSDSPQVLAVPTADHNRVLETLGLLVPDSGTALGDGLAAAVRLVRSSLAHDGVVASRGRRLPAAIVLLSDGQQNQGQIQPMQAAALARKAGIPVDTVALGTDHGILGYGPFAKKVGPAPRLMQQIAQATGGSTARARDTQELNGFYRRVGKSVGHGTRSRQLAAWFAAAAALLLAGAVAAGRFFGGALS